MPVARNLDTEFGWQRDDLASALRYQEISIPDVATAIYDEGGAESNSDLGTHARVPTTGRYRNMSMRSVSGGQDLDESLRFKPESSQPSQARDNSSPTLPRSETTGVHWRFECRRPTPLPSDCGRPYAETLLLRAQRDDRCRVVGGFGCDLSLTPDTWAQRAAISFACEAPC